MADTSLAAKSPLYAGRRRRNAIYKTLAWVATGFGLGWLVLILGVLLWQGIGGELFKRWIDQDPAVQSVGDCDVAADGEDVTRFLPDLLQTGLFVTLAGEQLFGRL